ncbi:hypothetical protein GS896_25715 [Rhodococcus hoagii]|nr:hypothetical protein [Prescottella equi]MBM4654096.1 hypothetical protein [Prescottella equi]MBM4719570.1 hypothetical protein [Prescottella equi]NKR23369.1 hypothetical protein [Prescottella equi]NKT56020.1 hypothetical protein [Prescottella equi]
MAIAPPVVVYQNSDFVGSLTQAVTNAGLARSGQAEFQHDHERGEARGRGRKAQLGAKAQAPLLGDLSVDVGANSDRSTTEKEARSRRLRVDVSYDIALHLHRLHDALDAQTTVVEHGDAEIGVGDIVKFTGTFGPDPVSAILDIASPELVAEITRFIARSKRPAVTGEFFDIDQLKGQWEYIEQQATARADLARAVTTALHTDFRRETTIEFHCTIAEGLTGVVACEAEHFVTADPDRLLDGEFTVFGKVISPPEDNVHILRKNKFLRRIDPDFLGWMFDTVSDGVDQANDGQVMDFARRFSRAVDPAPPIDLHFPSVIEGRSFAVLPIAIYA